MFPKDSSKSSRILYWSFTLVFIAILTTNKVFESSCWFYSDTKGEYSFSELLTNTLYLTASVLLVRMAYVHKMVVLYAVGAFCFWLFLEEANYGQIFWGGDSNFYENEEQAALHTQFLRPVNAYQGTDLAELLSKVLLGFFTFAIPLFLRYHQKVVIPLHHLWTPFALAVFCYFKWSWFLVPWSCGYDAHEEILETLMAATVLYWGLYYRIHLLRRGARA